MTIWDFDRMCVCGHRLAEHIAGGHECEANEYPRPHCECRKFKQKRTKGKKVIMNLEMAARELLATLERHGEWENFKFRRENHKP